MRVLYYFVDDQLSIAPIEQTFSSGLSKEKKNSKLPLIN